MIKDLNSSSIDKSMHMFNYVIARPKTLFSLHAIRGFAALGIVLFHLTNELFTRFQFKLLGGLFLTSYSGVDFFFILSGFVLFYTYHSKFGKKKEIVPFLRKRILRLYPTYWMITAIIIVGMVVLKSHAVTAYANNVPFIFKTIFLLPHDLRIIPPAWTLTYEVYFYCMFVLLFLFKDKKKLVWLGLLYSATIVMIAIWLTPLLPGLKVSHSAITLLQVVSGVYVIEFLMGMGTAYLVTQSKFIQWNKVLLGVGIVLFIVSSVANYYLHISGTILEELRFLYFGLPAAAIIFSSASIELNKPFLLPRFVTFLGDISFTLYLTHYSLIQLVLSQLGKSVNQNSSGMLVAATACLTLAGTLATGAVFHYGIEKRLRSLYKK